MREYLFRGKTDRGYWVEGSLIKVGDNFCCILPQDDGCYYEYPYLDGDLGTIDGEAIPVIPETVGQFTEMFDKNGKKIFEGDIIATKTDSTRTEKLKGYYGLDEDGYPKRIPGYEGYTEYHYPCVKDCTAVVKHSVCSGYYLSNANRAVNAICNEVVGNIYDNPDLLNDTKTADDYDFPEDHIGE